MLHRDIGAAPVVWVQRGIDAEPAEVGLHFVGSVADDVLWLEGLLFAPLLDRATMDGEHGVEGDQLREVGHGLGEFDNEGGGPFDTQSEQPLV